MGYLVIMLTAMHDDDSSEICLKNILTIVSFFLAARKKSYIYIYVCVFIYIYIYIIITMDHSMQTGWLFHSFQESSRLEIGTACKNHKVDITMG